MQSWRYDCLGRPLGSRSRTRTCPPARTAEAGRVEEPIRLHKRASGMHRLLPCCSVHTSACLRVRCGRWVICAMSAVSFLPSGTWRGRDAGTGCMQVSGRSKGSRRRQSARPCLALVRRGRQGRLQGGQEGRWLNRSCSVRCPVVSGAQLCCARSGRLGNCPGGLPLLAPACRQARE